MGKELIIATHNQGKAAEFKELFAQIGYHIKTLHDFPMIGEIEEDGATFIENALIKAEVVARKLHLPVLADDSGLSVDVLKGAPGVYSARYAGPKSSDEMNNKKLLQELKNIPPKDRTARFICTLALVKEGESPVLVTGEVTGIILKNPRGENGFGYDPLFYLPQFDQTFAELSSEDKNKISHRAQAIKKLCHQLPEWLFTEKREKRDL